MEIELVFDVPPQGPDGITVQPGQNEILVPEPATFSMFFLGGGMLLATSAIRRKSSLRGKSLRPESAGASALDQA